MGTRGSALFFDDNGMWARTETRWDGHTHAAMLSVAAAPFEKMARAENLLVASIAKGEHSVRLDNKWRQIIETMCQLPGREAPLHDFEALGDLEDEKPQLLGHLSGLAIQSALQGLDHALSMLAFGEFDACSNARDLCSIRDRWTVDQSGCGKIAKSAREGADFTVETLTGRDAIIRICSELDDDSVKSHALALEFDQALNGPLAPFHAYKISIERGHPKKRLPAPDILTIQYNPNWVFVALATLRIMGHPELGAGLRSHARLGPSGQTEETRHDKLAKLGLILAPTHAREFALEAFLGLPIQPAPESSGETKGTDGAEHAPEWIFKKTAGRDCRAHSLGPLTSHGDPYFTCIDKGLAATVGFAMACHWAKDEQNCFLAEGSFKTVGEIIGVDKLAGALSQALSQEVVRPDNDIIHMELARATQQALAQNIASPVPSSKRTRPRV